MKTRERMNQSFEEYKIINFSQNLVKLCLGFYFNFICYLILYPYAIKNYICIFVTKCYQKKIAIFINVESTLLDNLFVYFQKINEMLGLKCDSNEFLRYSGSFAVDWPTSKSTKSATAEAYANSSAQKI